MNIYFVQYFSTINWANVRKKYIAQTQEQVQELVNKNCPREHRTRHNEDSLDITLLESNVTLPYELE